MYLDLEQRAVVIAVRDGIPAPVQVNLDYERNPGLPYVEAPADETADEIDPALAAAALDEVRFAESA